MSVDYNEILEEDLKAELEWLEEEFEILFKLKENDEKDKKLANDILDYIFKIYFIYDNITWLHLLNKVSDNLEKTYPALF
ncbi:MAG: hypothetical protein ACFFFB_22505 [Candidatus Heimdallarchaeota archaeon]